MLPPTLNWLRWNTWCRVPASSFSMLFPMISTDVLSTAILVYFGNLPRVLRVRDEFLTSREYDPYLAALTCFGPRTLQIRSVICSAATASQAWPYIVYTHWFLNFFCLITPDSGWPNLPKYPPLFVLSANWASMTNSSSVDCWQFGFQRIWGARSSYSEFPEVVCNLCIFVHSAHFLIFFGSCTIGLLDAQNWSKLYKYDFATRAQVEHSVESSLQSSSECT